MRIDFHVHPLEPSNLEGSIPMLRRMGFRRFEEWMRTRNLSVEGLIEEMDRSGVDRTVILAVEYDVPDSPLLKVSNERVMQWVKRYPDRLIGFCSVCPTEKVDGETRVTENAVQRGVKTIRKHITENGFRGVKFLQPFQHFYPNNPMMFPIYEECDRLGVPIIIHTGGEDFPGLIKYCNPVYVDDVAKRFPNLRIVMAHMGSFPLGVWFKEAMIVTLENPNVYVDLAALRPRELIDEQLLEKAIRWVGSEKIIFGSDSPAVVDYPMDVAVQTILSANISVEDRENILGGNACRLLGLNNINTHSNE
jgi:uncharacterized protein